MLRMIDIDTALTLVREAARPRPAVELPLAECLGLTLAEPVRADRDYPPFVRAMMDGYAVRVADAGRTVAVVGEVAAGDPTARRLPAGGCVEIMTGAPCPEGTEAVVKKEDVERRGERVRLPAPVARGSHMVDRGAECSAGDVRLPAGTTVTPMAAGLAAAFGRARLRVVRRPTLAIVTTGSELVTDGGAVGPAQIRDSNATMLAGMARAAGLADIEVRHAVDTAESLATALAHARTRDLIVLSGGVSAGKYDLVPAAVERLGATPVFHKVRQKPGKPLLFATLGDNLVFGLPGTPLGSHLGFHRYVVPAARVMMGQRLPETWGHGLLTAPVETRGERDKFFLARAELARHTWQVTSVWGGSSSDMYSPAVANAYIHIPGGAQSLAAGAEVAFEWTVGGVP